MPDGQTKSESGVPGLQSIRVLGRRYLGGQKSVPPLDTSLWTPVITEERRPADTTLSTGFVKEKKEKEKKTLENRMQAGDGKKINHHSSFSRP